MAVAVLSFQFLASLQESKIFVLYESNPESKRINITMILERIKFKPYNPYNNYLKYLGNLDRLKIWNIHSLIVK